MPTDPVLYPDNWMAIAQELKEACDWRCSACDLACRRPGEPFDGHHRTLHVAHISQDYDAPEIFVACLCRNCHLIHDAPLSGIARQRRNRWRQRQAGQLDIFPNQ
jgi:hypothetical protein